MSRDKIQTEMVTFRAPAGTKQDLDVRARAEGYKDRSALLLNMIGVSQETALGEGADSRERDGGREAEAPLSSPSAAPSPNADEGKDKLERAHEAMGKASAELDRKTRAHADRRLLTHAHAANCPCSICTKSG